MADQAMMISTRYASLSDGELYAMYRGEEWSTLDEAARLDLLQETSNRVALEYSDPNPITVSFADLPSGEAGNENEHDIQISREMFVQDMVSKTLDDGTVIQMPMSDANYQALETILHESRHSIQESIIDGDVNAPEAFRNALEANDATLSVIDGQLGSQYLSGETGYEYYYCQPCELDAYRYSENKTQEIVESIRNNYGSDESMEAYLGCLSRTGVDTQLAEYNAKYGVDFEAEVSKSLQNTFDPGNRLPVDPQIEKSVRTEMIKSFEATYGGKPMMNPDKGYTPVTQAQFDASMRASTNAFYTHAMNDPSMSTEEAIAESHQVAERGLEASAEFAEQAAQNTAESSISESAGVSGEGTSIGSEGGGVSNGASASAGVGM